MEFFLLPGILNPGPDSRVLVRIQCAMHAMHLAWWMLADHQQAVAVGYGKRVLLKKVGYGKRLLLKKLGHCAEGSAHREGLVTALNGSVGAAAGGY